MPIWVNTLYIGKKPQKLGLGSGPIQKQPNQILDLLCTKWTWIVREQQYELIQVAFRIYSLLNFVKIN